jgi:predicted metal-dependent HD superfamily phosphohydrolase
MADELKETWLRLCRQYSTDPIMAEGLYEELHKKYASPTRYYHNLQHLDHLLRLAREYSAHLQNKEVVVYSIFYHDIIYNVLRKDNELRSAALAVKRLALLQLPAAQCEAVKVFIEATHTHKIPDKGVNQSDLAFFLDFDMAILGAPWEEYEVYTRQVRKEYRVYPDMLYKPGRKKFLQSTLQASNIFHTQLFKTTFEATARANMEKELLLYA